MNIWKTSITFLSVLLLAACATSPVAPREVEVTAIGPAHVLEGQGATGDRVVWGGRIVEVENLADRTELVIASYPLDRRDAPRINREAGVRFVLVEPGFLEPVDFAPGRYLTALGSIAGIEERQTGEFIHPHPVIEAERIHLWPRDTSQWQSRTGFSLGVGVSF